jgi:hypothetical protein
MSGSQGSMRLCLRFLNHLRKDLFRLGLKVRLWLPGPSKFVRIASFGRES